MAVTPSIFGICPQFVNAAGEPAVGDKLFFYIAGSNTKQNTYTNSTGSTANTNPIILNALGMPSTEIWWTTGQLYKMVWAPSTDTDPPTSPIRTFDNLSGINDTSSGGAVQSEWVLYTGSPTYISATSFSVAGNQTETFNVGRRLKTTNTAGTIYSTIQSAVFGSVTTITVINDSGVLDAGLSAVYYGILSATNPSSPGINTSKLLGRTSTGIGPAEEITVAGTLSLAAGVLTGASSAVSGVRQTVLSGPVDTNGFSAFGGSTGSTTVTASGTLIATAANGFSSSGNTDRIGSIVNPSWTGLSTNGAMYMYLDIAANGTCTTGTTALNKVEQWGGTYSTTNGQFTFNIQEMVGKVGNGAAAVQTYRVFVGEVTVAGGVVTAITWYQLMGRYDSGWTATLPSTNTFVSKNHNLGTKPICQPTLIAECTTIDGTYNVGDQVVNYVSGGAGAILPPMFFTTSLVAGFSTQGTNAAIASLKAGGNYNLTIANWKYKVVVQRGW